MKKYWKLLIIIRNSINYCKSFNYITFFFLVKKLIIISLISSCNCNLLLFLLVLSLFFVCSPIAKLIISSILIKSCHLHRFPLTLTHHSSLSSIASRLHLVSVLSCCREDLASHPTLAHLCEGVHRRSCFYFFSSVPYVFFI